MASTSIVECSRTENPKDIEKILFDNIVKRKWEEVVNMYGKYPWARKINITSSGTALHVAISDPKEKYKIVWKLLHHIKSDSEYCLDMLKLKNEKKQTPLHLAAKIGRAGRMCVLCIDCVGVGKASELIRERDKKGRTPLFLAVQYGRLRTFRYLRSVLGDTGRDFSFCFRDDGRSILHEAIIKENFELAFQIIHLYKDLVNKYDKQGESPLHALAKKPAAFPKGNMTRRGWRFKIIYHCIHVKELNPPDWNSVEFGTNNDIESGDQVSNIARENQSLIWSRISSCFVFSVKFIILKMAFIFGYGHTAVGKIKAEKERHVWADQVLKELLKHAKMYAMKASSFSVAGKDEPSKIEKKDTALLIAARYGIIEMVEKITDSFSGSIYDEDQDHKNILLVAVENRHLEIYKLLLKKYSQKKYEGVIFQKIDKKWNTALHLAATYGKKPWRVPGAALQMQLEFKWLEFVEKNMSPHMLLRTNKENKTPKEIFTDSHKDLVQEGGKWLTNTATACSVVAALIVTIAYTCSTTIPGGDRDTGKHIPEFELFAGASLAALGFSVTSLITFLAILTSRYEEKDFKKKLPMKILVGLTFLFLSIAAMLLTFSAGHFILFEDKFKYATVWVYAVILCIPLCTFLAVQVPLYLDIFRATFCNPS